MKFHLTRHASRFVYVCEVLAAGEYVVVTAFDLKQ